MKQSFLSSKQIELLQDELYKNCDMYEAYINDYKSDVKQYRRLLKHARNEAEKSEILANIDELKNKIKKEQKHLKKLEEATAQLYNFYY